MSEYISTYSTLYLYSKYFCTSANEVICKKKEAVQIITAPTTYIRLFI